MSFSRSDSLQDASVECHDYLIHSAVIGNHSGMVIKASLIVLKSDCPSWRPSERSSIGMRTVVLVLVIHQMFHVKREGHGTSERSLRLAGTSGRETEQSAWTAYKDRPPLLLLMERPDVS